MRMAEGMPSTEPSNLQEMLAGVRLRQGLPEDTTVLAADSLIAGAPRRTLTNAMHVAIATNKIEALNLSLTGMQLAEAARRLRAITGAPDRESIDPLKAGHTPGLLAMYALLSDGEQANYTLRSDPEMLGAAAQFDVAGRAYDRAYTVKECAQQEADLAEQVRTQRKRLSLVPRALIIALSTAILGGGGYAVMHDVQTHAAGQIAKIPAASRHGKRFDELRRDASPVQTDLLDGIFLLAGIGGGAIAAVSAESGIARRIAVVRIKHAQQALASARPPDEFSDGQK
jgi:hypothetical protein